MQTKQTHINNTSTNKIKQTTGNQVTETHQTGNSNQTQNKLPTNQSRDKQTNKQQQSYQTASQTEVKIPNN